MKANKIQQRRWGKTAVNQKNLKKAISTKNKNPQGLKAMKSKEITTKRTDQGHQKAQ